jgi:hypothetical protein
LVFHSCPESEINSAVIESTDVGIAPSCKRIDPTAGIRVTTIGLHVPGSIVSVCDSMESLWIIFPEVFCVQTLTTLDGPDGIEEIVSTAAMEDLLNGKLFRIG